MSVEVVELDDGTVGLEIGRAIDARDAAVKVDSEVRIGLGPNGSSVDLANLGFRTAAYLSGTIPEDLYVFATGDSDSSFSLGATYTEGDLDLVESMRQQPFEVLFNSESQYQIIDVNTQTVLAERVLGADRSLTYRGVRLDLTATPAAGDRFLVDGNTDGIGNNGVALRLAALQNEPVLGGGVGQTFQQAYAKVVGDVGDISFQATIAQKALQVVQDQAVQARDKVSGVSLDEEAADLIRFQQAYQASAKVMQTANTLFDAILGIR
jgi:flagellar hook-associated protein FlgK